MSPILLATDLSPWCDRAKERAILLARRLGRPLRVVVVVENDPGEAEMRRIATDLSEMLAAEAGDLATETVIRQGEAWEEIGAEVRSSGAGLVVMGRHRSDALRDFFLTPTAALVDAGPPILQAVNASSGAWRDVVVCTDFSERGRRALDQAVALAG
ncbi:MAG TPA: universal stress protein, partial [Candidatus Omnitrophota bacterium]|nr:universal stress protein [Candidatus Omnitrophota bacterium]